jgi:catechol 2,3-dioxygenase-like lactoylglutathione lyase family enzyme
MDGAQLLHVGVPTTDVDAAAAFFCAVGGMKVVRKDALGNSFVGFGSEADGEHFALKLTPSTEALTTADLLAGASVCVASVDAAVAAAVRLGAAVLRPVDNVTYVASLVPDEDCDLPQPWLLRAVVQDAYSGLPLELVEHAPAHELARAAAGAPALAHVTLRVPDLNAASDFFTQRLGMALHRKRSLVPTEPALSCWVSYATSELSGTNVELRYSYGLTSGRGSRQRKAATRDVQLVVGAVDVAAAVAELCEPFALPEVEDDRGRSGAAGSMSPGCSVVSEVGAVEGVGEEAALLQVAEPAVGVQLALVDQLDFLKQTLLAED